MNRLTLVGPTNLRGSDRHILFYYDCSCGGFAILPKRVVDNGNTRSCGCLKREVNARMVLKVQHLAAKAAGIANHRHGLHGTKFYKHWRGMHDRCNDKSNKDYGGRGISVCSRWSGFVNFRDDMYESYLKHIAEYGSSRKDISIDRIDVNGDYEPSNVRWATSKEQALNKRK